MKPCDDHPFLYPTQSEISLEVRMISSVSGSGPSHDHPLRYERGSGTGDLVARRSYSNETLRIIKAENGCVARGTPPRGVGENLPNGVREAVAGRDRHAPQRVRSPGGLRRPESLHRALSQARFDDPTGIQKHHKAMSNASVWQACGW